jgi:hypothetical protein
MKDEKASRDPEMESLWALTVTESGLFESARAGEHTIIKLTAEMP